VRVLRLRQAVVSGAEVGGGFLSDVASGRERDARRRGVGKPLARRRLLTSSPAEVGSDASLVNDRNANRLVRTGLHARRGFADSEAAVAHVALAHDAARRRILRHVVGTFQDAVAAADALVVEVADDAGDGVFVVGEHGAAFEAAWLNTVVAGGGDNLLERNNAVARESGRSRSEEAANSGNKGFTEQRADFAPGLAVIKAVERVAGGDTGLATGAFVQVHLEGILLARTRSGCGEQLAIVRLDNLVPLMRAREGFHRGEPPLLVEQRVHERLRASGTGGIPGIGVVEHRHTCI